MVFFRPGSLEAVVRKRPAETVKQPPTVKPSTQAPTVKSRTLFKEEKKTRKKHKR